MEKTNNSVTAQILTVTAIFVKKWSTPPKSNCDDELGRVSWYISSKNWVLAISLDNEK